MRALAPADIAARAGLLWVPASVDREDPEACAASPAGHFEIAAFGATARLSWPDLSFESPSPLLMTFPWRLIALHHLAMAGGAEPGEDWVSYRELPDGLFYANTITREVEEPLARLFGADPAAFLAAGASLGRNTSATRRCRPPVPPPSARADGVRPLEGRRGVPGQGQGPLRAGRRSRAAPARPAHRGGAGGGLKRRSDEAASAQSGRPGGHCERLHPLGSSPAVTPRRPGPEPRSCASGATPPTRPSAPWRPRCVPKRA